MQYDGHAPIAAHPGFVRLVKDKGEPWRPNIRRRRRFSLVLVRAFKKIDSGDWVLIQK